MSKLQDVQNRIKELHAYADTLDEGHLFSEPFTTYSREAVYKEILRLEAKEWALVKNIDVTATIVQYNHTQQICHG